MTRKHFEALALALKQTKPDAGVDPDEWAAEVSEMSQWRADVRAIAEVLLDISRNPGFDTRFYAACGYEDTEGVKS